MKTKCPDCGGPLCLLMSLNEKHCFDCGKIWNWQLDEGQLPLVGNNRQKNVKKVLHGNTTCDLISSSPEGKNKTGD